MPAAVMPDDEQARLKALFSYEILDTTAEEAYDQIVSLASVICQTPIALVSLIEENRQWFKAKKGLDVDETPRELAFCAHAILDEHAPLIGEDASKDPRFSDNVFVVDDPNIRFYVGYPLTTPSGDALGTLCAIDTKPNTVTEEQLSALKTLANNVVHLLELRRSRKALNKTIQALSLAVEGIAKVDGDGNLSYLNDAYASMLGYTPQALIGQPANLLIAKASQDKVQSSYELADLLGKVSTHAVAICKDGQALHTQMTIVADDDGLLREYFCFIQDTSESKKEEVFLSGLHALTAAKHLDANAKISEILSLGLDFFNLTLAMVSRVDGVDYKVAYCWPEIKLLQTQRFKLDESYCGVTMASGTSQCWEDRASSSMAEHRTHQLLEAQAYIGVPVYADDQPYGTVTFSATAARKTPFTKREEAFAKLIGQLISSELTNLSNTSKTVLL